MKISKTWNGKVLTVCPEGILDTNTAPELKQVLGGAMGDADALVLDLGKLEYVTSAGLRVMLTTHTAMVKKGGVKILHVNEEIMDSLEMTGLADVLDVEKA